MAYAYTVTYFQQPISRGSDTLYGVTIEETDAGPTSEWEMTGIPPAGVIVAFTSTLESGTGVTLEPSLGYSSSFVKGAASEVGTMVSVPPTGRVSTNSRLCFQGVVGGTLYGNSGVDAGADNVIKTTLLFKLDV